MRPPPLAMPAGVRGYPRGFDWTYDGELPPGPDGGRPLIPVVWDGLWLNTGDQDSGLCSVIEDVSGVLDSPPLEGNDVQRVISDGAAWGPKVLRARTITLAGAAAGPAAELAKLRTALAVRAAAREPAELAFGAIEFGRVFVTDVRAGAEAYRLRPLGRGGFRWQVTLTAADPAFYDWTWQTAVLSNITPGETGRDYAREYPVRYAVPYLANTALLRNDGNHPAPVYALYEGPLSQSSLTGPGGDTIRVAPIDAGVLILVSTATLIAEAPGGLSRASYILPGSRPLVVAPASSSRWALRSTGAGSITLAWRSAWV